MAKPRLRQNKNRQCVSVLPLKWTVLIHVINLSAPQAQYFFNITLCFKWDHFPSFFAKIQVTPFYCFDQALSHHFSRSIPPYHHSSWSSHSFPSYSNALLEFAIKQHSEQNSDFQMSEDTSFLFPSSLPASASSPICWISTTCPLGPSLFQVGESWSVLLIYRQTWW